MEIAELCGGACAGLFTQAQMHTPVALSERAGAHAREIGADVLIAVGGGSTTGLAKAVALRTDLPQIIIPTTYAGSEATAIPGQTENGVKTTLTSPRVQPEVVLYDPELIVTLPVSMTVTSALNAMAHAAEGLYAHDRSPLSTLMALEGLRAFRDALPRVVASPGNLLARGETLYGAWLCGTVLGQVGMALHHKLCHTLGDVSICPTPKPTPSSCPMPSPTMPGPFPTCWPLWPICLAAGSRDRRSTALPAPMALRWRCVIWDLPKPLSTRSSISRWPNPTPTRVRLNASRCGHCCRPPGGDTPTG
jgi:hypothetical protein